MYRILIADDEAIERRVLRRKLEKNFGENAEILEAVNGREVLKLHKEKTPRILILDIEMPRVTGLEAAERIRLKDSECSIIFLTAFDEFSYAKKAITVRAMDYLLKPCAEKELIAAVEEAMRRADAAEERQKKAAALASDGPAPVPETEKTAGTAAGQNSLGEKGFSGQQEAIRAYIDRHYMFDLSVQDMADELGYSEAYFCKLFKQYFGQSFVSYLTEYRISLAAGMLGDGSVSIKDAGKAVGYPDPNYFTKVFRRIKGISPTEFRNNAQKQAE